MGKNWNIYEHEKLKSMQHKHPDWIWNRGDTHVILGQPGSLEAFKTPVDPGNSFSPGPGTYGVSSWIFTNDKLHAPEEKDISELEWSFEEGFLPILNSRWNAGNVSVKSSIFADGDYDMSDYKNYFMIELENQSSEPVEASLYLAIRSFGAAGGPIESLAYKEDMVFINGAPLVLPEDRADAFGAISYSDTKDDISSYLRKGQLPKTDEIVDESTWASGALEYKVKLNPKEKAKYNFVFHMHTGHWMLDWIKPPTKPFCFEEIREKIKADWKKALPIRLDLPDKRFADALNCQLTHLYMFTVADDIRITPVSYPLWWLRDGAYVLNALNKGGLHDFSERACRKIADKDAFGGFGSEGDGPSDGIWVLSEHYLLTKDKAFLKEMIPHIQRKADLIMKMRRTKKPIKIFTEFVIPKCMLDPNTDILCLAAEDGLINGRMDHHFPIMWINGFAYLALMRTVMCFEELGLDASLYKQEADDLKKAIIAKSRQVFGEDDRDINSAFWPAGWASRDDEFIAEKFEEYWKNVKFPNGKHNPEPLWTYFEAGQSHNYMLLGEREKAWVSIEWFLSNQTAPGLYTYPEGIDGNTALLWPRTRGWDDVECVTPHGWTAAEVFHLLRDCLVREEGDNLIIGSGIPKEWLREKIEVKDMPTYFGKVSFAYDPLSNEVKIIAPNIDESRIKLEFPVDVKRV